VLIAVAEIGALLSGSVCMLLPLITLRNILSSRYAFGSVQDHLKFLLQRASPYPLCCRNSSFHTATARDSTYISVKVASGRPGGLGKDAPRAMPASQSGLECEWGRFGGLGPDANAASSLGLRQAANRYCSGRYVLSRSHSQSLIMRKALLMCAAGQCAYFIVSQAGLVRRRLKVHRLIDPAYSKSAITY